ncbi:hypothetical protein OUZ56_024604 [Daphnia magna]|uniref:Uncharacterized protein n=1 Tax=Daphnia magna TaxID=35525 RepID=A0ABR0B123_9CRUS|nr:hypothetical protein OUZ56_024604 [Daphnia magna]
MTANTTKPAMKRKGPRGKIPQVGIQPWQLSIRSWSIRTLYVIMKNFTKRAMRFRHSEMHPCDSFFGRFIQFAVASVAISIVL